MAEEILNNDPLGILSKQTAQTQVQDPLGILKKKSTPLESSVTPLPSQDKFQLEPKPQDKFKQGLQFAQEGFKMPSADVQRQRKEQGYLLNTISALDRGFAKNLVGNPVKGLGTLLQGTTAKVLGGSGKGFVSEALIDFGDYFNKTIDELAPQDEDFKNSLTDQFAQAMGQFGSLVLTGGMTGAGAKAPALVSQALPKGAVGLGATAAKGVAAELASPVSISAGLSMGQSEFERAKEFGANDDQAFEAFYKNAAVGSILEKIPTMQFLKRFNQSTGGGVANFIKTKGVAGITGGLEEMSTEILQQLYANKTAKDIYNINQEIFEGVGESGGIGFGVGFLINAMGANARLLKRQGKKDDAKLIEDQVKSFESKLEQETKKADQDKIKINEIADKLERNELVPLDDIEFYQANKEKVDKTLTARKLETEATAPSVIMPEENVAPEVVEPTRPAVIMPKENVPAETTLISPEQQGKGAAVIMPEANVAPEVAETVVTEEEVKPTEVKVKPEVKSKLESFKTKFAPQPKEVKLSAVSAAQKRVDRRQANRIVPTDARGFALSWMNQSPDVLDWNSIKDLFGGRKATLNIKEATPEEIAKRDYVAEKEDDIKAGDKGKVMTIDAVVNDIWNNLPDGLEDKITTRDIKDELEALISEYPTRAEAARALIEHEGAAKGKSLEEQQLAFEERRGIDEEEETAPIELEGGFVPFEEDIDIEGMEEAPFAVQESATEEVAAMQDIVKDYIDDGTTSLSEIKKAIAKELGYNTKKLRQTIEDAFNEYTKTQEAAPKDVVGGVVGRIGNALKKMFGKDAQKPFIAKDGKGMQAKLDEIREDVKFQIAGGFRSTNDMPIAYRYDTDQVARERYDIPKLKKIGEGSDRVVFDLKDGNVLKIAKTPRGLEQNIYEGDYYLAGSVLPDIIERGINYIVVEKVDQAISRTIDLGIAEINIEIDKKEIGKLNDLLKQLKQFTQKDFDNHDPKLQQILEDNDLTDIMNYDVIWNDFTAKRNWGLKNGEPIHLDGGTFGGIQMLDRFKGQKPLSDPDFRDIYNKSKKAKIENKDVDKFTKFMAMPKQNLAPNGKPSNLTSQQYEQIRTKKFKDWFGDWENDPENSSKVVDENGEPMVVFHGTNYKIDEFKNTNPNITGYYFSSDFDNSNTYGESVEMVYLNIRSPFIVDSQGKNFTEEVSVEVLTRYPNERPYKAIVNTYSDDIVSMVKGDSKKSFWEIPDREKFDGVIFNNFVDPSISSRRDVPQDTFVAFAANQIKSATKNIGDFSQEDNRIRFMSDADILGFTFNNKMYLNGSALNPNTPIHEAGHIWVEWTKTNDPKIYAKGMELVKDSPYYKKAKESKFYQEQANNLPENQREDYYSNEALAMAIGDKGAQFVVESKKDAFKDWLKTLWNKIKSLTGFKDLTEEQFQNLTFEEFSKMAVKEILGVENDLDKFKAARSIKKKKDFVKSKVRGEANKNAIDDFEVDDMIKLIKVDYDLQTLKNIKNAIQERSAKEILPSKPSKARETRGERRRVEPRVEGDEATGEGKTAPTEGVEEIPEEIENVGIEDQDIDYVGITEEELNDLRESLGLPKYQGLKRESHEQLQEMAAKMVKKGFNIEKLYNKIRKGGILTNYENAFMAEYRAALDLELKNNPSPELLEKVKEFTETFQPAASRLGKALESLKIVKKLNQANTLSNFLLMRQEDKGFNLSEKLILQESERFEKIQKVKEDLQFSVDQDLENQLKAEAQKEVKAKPKKTSEEYAQERKEALAAAREAMRKIRTGEQGLKVSILGVNEIQTLVAIAPHMNKYFKSIVAEKVSQGVAKLDDIVNEVYDEFKGIVDGLTKRDVLDVIAGKYNAKRKTENELNAGLRLLRREAQLISDLEAARKNEDVAKTERELAKTSKRIKELEAKINEVRNLNAMKEFAEDGVYEKSPTIGKKETSDQYYDQKRQRFLEKKIKNLENDIKNKNYEKEVVEAPRPKSSDKTRKLEDRVVELEKKLAKDRLADQQNNLKGYQKAFDNTQKVLGIKRILQTSIDASIWLRQLSKISFNIRHYDITLKFLKASGQSVFSQKNYDRLMYKIKKAPDYEESVKDGIKYNDLDSQEQSDMFPKSFIFEIPFLREPLLASQRVADGSLNIARYELYNKYKRELLKQGITRESDPQMYEAMAKLVMNSTGSGNMLKFLETPDAQRVMGATFYGAKLMAANFNTLNPVYYAKMPKEVRMMAMKDLASHTSMIISIMLACVAAGATVSLDPDDPDFLQVRFGDKKVFDFTAGQAAYIRTFLRWVEAGYARATKSKFEASEAASFAWGSTLRFFRNKLAPNNAYLVNAIVGKNSLGEDFDPMEIFYAYPMYADDAYEAAKEDGFVSLLTVLLANIIGIGYSSYYTDRAMKPLDEIISRAQNSDEVDPRAVKKDITKDEFKQYTKLRDQLIADKIKELYEQGNDDDVMVKDMTNEELAKEITKLKRRATTEAKKELDFDKEEE